MNIDELKQNINSLDATALKDFIFFLYQQHPELQTTIETLALFNDPKALAKAILKRIQSVSRGRKYIDWRMSGHFAQNLDAILIDIEKGLLTCEPKQAYDLTTKFLATSPKVLERVDDSSGEIGGVYFDAIFLWLKAANAYKTNTLAGAKINWLEHVYQLNLDNDYGVYDALLPNSDVLLNHDELSQLAWRYEAELKQAIKEDKDGYGYITKLVALQSVAEALKNPKLYERAMLISSPKPNDMQKEALVKMYLKFNKTTDALRWLTPPWERRFELDRLQLLAKAHEQSADSEALKQVYYQRYQHVKCYDYFLPYFNLLNKTEQKIAKNKAIKIAEQANDLMLDLELLLSLNEPKRAETLVLKNLDGVANGFYNSLLNLAKLFEKQQCWNAVTACYRSLLLDILNQGKSKAYTHAAKYYKKLIETSVLIEDYKTLQPHDEFTQLLLDNHGLKRSFWTKVQ